MVSKCKQMKTEYTGNNYSLSRHFNPSYLVSNVDELNILANSMGNRLGITYTTKLLNCHRHQNGVDAVCWSTVNLDFQRLAPKITIIQKIQQGTKNEGKWKEARQRHTKKMVGNAQPSSRGQRVSIYRNDKTILSRNKVRTSTYFHLLHIVR